MSFNCPICLELLTSEGQPRTTNCGHVFHGSCLMDWLKKGSPNAGIDGLQGRCPSCSKQIQWTNTIRLFFCKEEEDDIGVQKTMKTKAKVPSKDKEGTAGTPPSGPLNSNKRSVNTSAPAERIASPAAPVSEARTRFSERPMTRSATEHFFQTGPFNAAKRRIRKKKTIFDL